MTDAKLLPCPFCGNDGKDSFNHPPELDEFYHSWFLKSYRVKCGECSARRDYSDSEEDAVAAWNRRAAPQGDDLQRAASVLLGAWHEGRLTHDDYDAGHEIEKWLTNIALSEAQELDAPRDVVSQHVDTSMAILHLEKCPNCKEGSGGHLHGDIHQCAGCGFQMPLQEWPAEKGLYRQFPGAKKWPSYQRWVAQDAQPTAQL